MASRLLIQLPKSIDLMKQFLSLYKFRDEMITLLSVDNLQQLQQIRMLSLLQNSSLFFHSLPILLSLDLPLHYYLNRYFLTSRSMHCLSHLAKGATSERASQVVVKEPFRHFRTCVLFA